MEHAASTALPPFWNVIAPAVAASGFPVTASQWLAWSGGLFVAAPAPIAAAKTTAAGGGGRDESSRGSDSCAVPAWVLLGRVTGLARS